MDVGASLGIPALTAHRCLTVSEPARGGSRPERSRGGRSWWRAAPGRSGTPRSSSRAGPARVVTTVSNDEKARLAQAAGADHIVNYRSADVADEVRELAPAGVDIIVEVAPIANAALGEAVLAAGGTIAVYATDDGDRLELSIGELMDRNARYQFVLVYTVPSEVKDEAVADVSAAVADGSLPVGADAGLPLHRFELGETADAHAAVEGGAVGKVLIDVS